jgi:hypothetical protein
MDKPHIRVLPQQFEQLQAYEKVTGTSAVAANYEALSDFIEYCVRLRLESIAKKGGNASHGMNYSTSTKLLKGSASRTVPLGEMPRSSGPQEGLGTAFHHVRQLLLDPQEASFP